jgi:hypothetical protein
MHSLGLPPSPPDNNVHSFRFALFSTRLFLLLLLFGRSAVNSAPIPVRSPTSQRRKRLDWASPPPPPPRLPHVRYSRIRNGDSLRRRVKRLNQRVKRVSLGKGFSSTGRSVSVRACVRCYKRMAMYHVSCIALQFYETQFH